MDGISETNEHFYSNNSQRQRNEKEFICNPKQEWSRHRFQSLVVQSMLGHWILCAFVFRNISQILMLPHWASDFASCPQVLSLVQVSDTVNFLLYSRISKLKILLQKLAIMPFSPINIITPSVAAGEKCRDRNSHIWCVSYFTDLVRNHLIKF